MNVEERAMKILELLEDEYPDVRGTALNWETPMDLLVATILSAQSTDEQINEISKDLFEKYRTPKDYSEAPREELEEDIRSSGFYHRKADYIQSSARTIIEEFDGKVPDSMDDLLKLKGVARKTANIVLQNAFNKNVGIAVDTHVLRLSHRLGLSEEGDRDKVERDLMEVFPLDKWRAVNYLLIAHGRRICEAKKPLCSRCVLSEICPSAFTFPHNKKD